MMDSQEQEREALMRQRAMAQLLQQQGQAPQGQMVSGRYVQPSWAQYLNSAVSNYRGNEMNRQADTKQKAMAAALQGKKDAWLNEMPQNKPAQTMDAGSIDPSLADVGPIETAPPQNPTSDDFLKWGMKGMQIDPNSAQVGMKMADRSEAREQQIAQAKVLKQQRLEELQIRMQDARTSAQERMQMQQEAARLQREFQADMARQSREQQVAMAKLTASMRPAPDPHLVQIDTPNGPQYVASRDAVGKTPFNKEKAGEGNKVKDAQDAIALIDQADVLLDKATSSGVGRGVDAAAALFGKSTDGAQASAQLKALEGMLVSKMPKMSGPQSDKDVALYKQMAASIGDSTVPVDTRRAALKTVREIQERYAGQTTAPATTAPSSGHKSVTVDW